MDLQPQARDGVAGPVDAPAAQADAIAVAIASLRARGAQHADPIGFGRIEALARRSARQPAEVRRLLEDKLRAALNDCEQRVEQARARAAAALPAAMQRMDGRTDSSPRVDAAGNVAGLRRLDADADSGQRPLAALLRDFARHAAPTGRPATAADGSASAEPKALREGRELWTRLAVERRLSRSLQHRPTNPGPLNSHQLVLRALRELQATAPEYLHALVARVDLLLWLDQASFGVATAAGRAARSSGNATNRRGRRGGS